MLGRKNGLRILAMHGNREERRQHGQQTRLSLGPESRAQKEPTPAQ